MQQPSQPKVSSESEVDQSLTEPENADARNSPRRMHLRTAVLLGTLLVLLGVGWLLDAPGIWMRSLAERSLRKYDPHAALIWVDRALRYAPHDASGRFLGARAYLQLNLNSAAQEIVDSVDRQVGPQAESEALRLMVAAQRGDLDAALQLMNWQADFALPPEAFEAIIRCAQYRNKRDWAELMLSQLEQTDQAVAMVAYQRGRLAEIDEDFAAAAEHFIAAFQAQPHMTRAAFRAGACYYQLRQFKRSADLFRAARQPPYNAIASIELCNCLWELGELDEASRLILPTLAQKPEELQSLYLQVDEYVDGDRAALVAARIEDGRRNSERAVEFLQRVLAYNHRDFEARELLIKNLRLLKRTTEADALAAVQREMVANRLRCRDLRLELEERPQDIDIRCELAELYWYTESVAEARLAVEEIFELDPNCERAHQLLAKIDAEQKSRQAIAP